MKVPPYPHGEEMEIPDMGDMSMLERLMLDATCEKYGISADNFARFTVLAAAMLAEWLLKTLVAMHEADHTDITGKFRFLP